MKKKLIVLAEALVVMGIPGLLMAAEEAAAGAAAAGATKSLESLPYFTWATVAIALGFSLAAGLCGIGQGMAVAKGLEGIARQPEATNKIQVSMLLGLAFIESLSLFVLFVSIVLLFANPFIKYLQ